MHFVIVGAGRVGRTLAMYLADREHKVVLIDKHADPFRKIERHSNIQTLVGVGFEKSVLEAAHIEEADGLAAVTSGDNSNVVIARIAKETFKVPHVAARIYDPTRAGLYQRLGISTVATVSWTTDQFIKKLAPENETVDWVDPSGEVVVVDKLLPSHWAGKKIEDLFNPGLFTPIAISHLGKISIPSSQTKAHEDDRIFVACQKENIDQLEKLLSEGPQS